MLHIYRVKLHLINDNDGTKCSVEKVMQATCVDNAISIAKCCAGALASERFVGSETQRAD